MADSKYENLRDETPPFVIAPFTQLPSQGPGAAMMIRSSLPPEVTADSVKRRIGERHPEITAYAASFQTMIHNRLLRERLMAILSGFFGLLAALLGMLGLYGVISYLVMQRRNEIGIRVALGAGRGEVIRMIMREAGLLLAVGVAIGMRPFPGRGARRRIFIVRPEIVGPCDVSLRGRSVGRGRRTGELYPSAAGIAARPDVGAAERLK